jgi:lipopolysaccharide/colanic/teichoic acid biosynthesis glycosyltransferase
MLVQNIGFDHQETVIISDTEAQRQTFYFACKRALDLVLAAALLLLLSPLLLLIAVLVKLDSSGPALFVQQRVGARRRVSEGRTIWEIQSFPCYKFRSMVRDADQSLHQDFIKAFAAGRIETSPEVGSKFKLTDDPRVTRVGRILRKTSLDELPQLVNVLRGEMSLVGPRPVPTYEVTEYQGHHYERLAALPGITGLWQVKGRSQVSFDNMIDLDIEYVRNKSLWLDMKILVSTIPAVLSARGAE